MDMILLQKPLQTQTPVNSQSVNTAVWEMFLLSLVWSDISCFSLTFLLVERWWLPSPEKRFGSCGTSPGNYEPQLDVCPVFSTAVLIWHMIAASDRLHDVEAKQTVTLLINKELWFIHFTVRRAWWKQKKKFSSHCSYRLFRKARVSKPWVVLYKEVRYGKSFLCIIRLSSPLKNLNQFQTLGLWGGDVGPHAPLTSMICL